MQNAASKDKARWRAAWQQIRTLYACELRGALRERSIVINSILIPIFLYPLMMWAGFTAVMFIQGQSDTTLSRIAVGPLPAGHSGLRARLEHHRKLELMDQVHGSAAEAIQRGTIDAAVEFLPATGSGAALPGNFQVQITYNGSRDGSVRARERVEGVVDDYRRAWLKREAAQRGITPAEWASFRVELSNLASTRQMGRFVLGMMLPILFVVMVAAGSFYPAVDCTAGERERSTWETLMTSAATRGNIVAAKYLYVATLGGAAGALNLLAFAVTAKPIFAPLLAAAGTSLDFSIPLAAIPLLLVAAALLAGFVAAGMMIFASFARTFKEGQAMIMPFYLLVLLPPMFVQSPGIQFTVPLACVPVTNVTLLVRSVIAGSFPWLQIAITVIVSLAAIALCLRVAAFILKFEDVAIGSYNGSLKSFFRERVLGRARRAGQYHE